MSSTTIPIDDTYYKSLLLQMETADAKFTPTKFWKVALEKISDELLNGGVEKFRCNKNVNSFFEPLFQLEGLSYYGKETVDSVGKIINGGDGDSTVYLHTIPGHTTKGPALMKQLVSGYHLALSQYCAFKAGDIQSKRPHLQYASDSGIGGAINQHQFDGKSYSRTMLNYMTGLVFLKQNIKDTSMIQNVLEIGGGFGSMGEILLSDAEVNYNYVNVDIPPTLYAASWYLKKLYREKYLNCLAFKPGDSISFDKMDGNACVAPTWQLPDITGRVDLFINFHSFQEMEPDVVVGYIEHIQRLKAKYVLTRNIREGKNPKRVVKPIKSEDYDQFFVEHDYIFIASNVIPFGFKTCDGFHSELRLYRHKSAPE
jgi:putative sugar O-methyltransferase